MEEPFESDGVCGTLHRPDTPSGDALILTHGAGSNAQAPSAGAHGARVCRRRLPGAALRSAVPPRSAPRVRRFPPQRRATARASRRRPKPCAALRRGACSRAAIPTAGGKPPWLAAERPGLVDGLLLLSYPLHPPVAARPEAHRFFPRTAHARPVRARHRGPVRLARGVARSHGADPRAHRPLAGGRRGPRSEARAGSGQPRSWSGFRALVCYPGN